MDKIKVYMMTTWEIKCGIANYSSYLYHELDKLDCLDAKIIPIKNPDSLNPIYFIRLLRQIKNPDIIHIQYQNTIFGNVPLIGTNAKLKNIYTFIFLNSYFPIIISILKLWKHYNVVTTVHEFGVNSFSEKILLKFLNLSDYLIFHEDKTLNMLKKAGIKKEKLLKIPIGVLKAKILDKNESKQKLGVSQKKVITIFGFLHKNKGHDLVIDVFPKLDNNTILLIAGGIRLKEHEEYYQSLKDKVNKLGLEDKVIFLNFVEDSELPVVFSATDMFIFPYRFIQVSGALALVLNYNNPIITSNIDYFKEFKEEYNCIELFDLNNRDDLLKTINEILNSKEKQEYLKERCKNAYDELNWGKIAEKTCKTYLNLVNAKND